MKARVARNILIGLLAFLGLGAVFGGGVFIASPSGKLLGMPLTILERSPFSNFLLPGIILFILLGLAPIGLILALIEKPESKIAERINFFKDMHWSWSYSIYVAFALIIWIHIQIVFIGGVHWLHTFYIFLAIVIIFVALLKEVRELYRR